MSESNPMKQRLDDDLKAAMKARDQRRVDVLRMVKAKMIEAEVSLRAKRGRDYQLDEAESNQVLTTCAKQRRESIESFKQGGREDLVAAEEAELAILAEYLPKQLATEEVTQIVKEAIASTGAMSMKDMGAVMKIVMPKVQGAADGKEVNRIVGGLLGGKGS